MSPVRRSHRPRRQGRAASVVAFGMAVGIGASVPAALGQAADPCAGWEVRTLVSGLGLLENLEFDGAGGMLLSTERDRVERLLTDGTVEVAFEDLPAPGGLRVREGSLFVNTGNGLVNGATGQANGTIERIDLVTGERETWAEGLVMPNGLVFDDAGRAFTSRDLGVDGAISVVPPEPPRTPRRFAEIRDTNGLAIDAAGEWLYAVTTFDPTAPVQRVRLDDPTVIESVASLALVGTPVVKGLDDMTFDGADVLWITANGTGEVLRLDPATGEACVVASGIGNPTSVKLGAGPGWDPTHLYVTAWDGAVRELVPPDGAAPTPLPIEGPAEDPTEVPPTPTAPPTPSAPASPAADPPGEAAGGTDLPATGAGAGAWGALGLLGVVTARRGLDRAGRGSA